MYNLKNVLCKKCSFRFQYPVEEFFAELLLSFILRNVI